MEEHRAHRIVICFFLGFLLIWGLSCDGLWAAETFKPSSLGVFEQIKKTHAELEKLKKETEGKRKKNIAIRKKEESILSTLEEMDDRLRVRQNEAELIELKIREKENEIDQLSVAVRDLGGDIHQKRAIIARRLRTIYQGKKNVALRVLLASHDYPDFLRRFYYLHAVAKKEGEILSVFKEKYSQSEVKGRQLVLAKEDLEHERMALAQKLSEIRSEKRDKSSLLSRVRDERAYYERALAEIDESSLQLQALVKRLEDEKARTKKRESPEKFSSEKGRLNWPNNGPVVSLFGRQKHAKFDTYVYRRGIEIAPSKGEGVRAIYDGLVVYADWLKGYGMVVMLDHGENYYSMYAHLVKLSVAVADRVAKGRAIGLVGETGLSKEGRLYFEIRHQGEPLDPLTWLQKRR